MASRRWAVEQEVEEGGVPLTVFRVEQVVTSQGQHELDGLNLFARFVDASAGCKIKALRAKTNTYIKTPVRGEEPVFVVTGRREDVQAAKKEIEAAADHFTQIRASRRGSSSGYVNGSSSNGGPPSPPGGPGQVTLRVPVPYRVVGLVVGPKGATIKRIQQQTHTYIVTPSRDRDPVFEITGTMPNVNAAKREIEQHIASRTGLQDNSNMPNHPNHSQSQGSPGQQPQQLHHPHSLMPGVNGSTDRFRQNGHHGEQQNGMHGRYTNGSVFDHRRNGQCLADEFHANGSDAVFNNISASVNGNGDVLGYQSNYLFGSNGSSSNQFHSNGSSSTGSNHFGFGAANGVSDSLAGMSNGFGGAAGNDGSAFSFSSQDQYMNFLQQNSQLLGGYEAQQNGLSMDEFKMSVEQPPSLQGWNRPLSFGGDNAPPTGLHHRRSSSYAGSGQCIACGGIDGHTGACSMDRSRGGDVRSAPATARFSPPGLVDFVNGTATPPMNGTSSPPTLMANGFSPNSALDFDMSGATLNEQHHQSVRRIRSDPLASGLQVGLGNLTAVTSPTTAPLPYPSTVTTTTATTVSSAQQDPAPSPPPLDLVGLSLSDELLGNSNGLTNGHDSGAAAKLGNEQRMGKCVRCQDHKDLTCLVPCGHMIFCKDCADVLTSEAGEEQPACPTCEQPFSLGVIPRKG
nr:hypothetical protein BaRGS_018339 [Batillaria attramentaria]